MGLRFHQGPWWPETNFLCPKCGKYCDGKNNSMVLAGDNKILRWCDECDYI